MKKILTLFALVFSIHSFAQNHWLEGIITYQNTGDILPNVKVYDASDRIDANADYSDVNGVYRLKFVEKKEGDPVKIKAFLAGHQIVNEKEVNNFTLPANKVNRERYRIVLCKREEYNERKVAYYAIFLEEFTVNLNREIDALEKQLSTKGSDFEKLMKNKERLETELSEVTIKANEIAQKFAAIDLSRAFDWERTALEFIENREVKKAISLYEKNLQPTYEKVIKRIEEDEENVRKLVASYQRQAELYEANIELYKSMEAWDTVIFLQQQYKHLFDAIAVSNNLFNISYMSKVIGELIKAETYQKKCLQLRQRFLIGNDSLIAQSLNMLSIINHNLGRLDSALIYQKKCLNIRSTVLNIDDLGYSQSLSNLALIYHDFGNLDSALIYQWKAINLINKNTYLKSYKYQIGVFYNNIASIYCDLGILDSALNFQLKSIDFFREDLNKFQYQDKLADTFSNLSVIFQQMGMLDSSIIYINKSIKIKDKIYKSIHPDLANSYDLLSQIFLNFNRIDSAKIYQEKALYILGKIYEENHPDILKSYNTMAAIFLDIDLVDSALFYQHKALLISQNIYDYKNPRISTIYNNLSLMYLESNKIDSALFFQIKCIEIRERIYEPLHPDLATAYNNLSSIYRESYQLNSALSYQLKALKIQQEILSPLHPNISTSYNNLSLIYQSLGKFDIAISYQLKAIEIREIIYQTPHKDLVTSNHNLASIYAKSKKINLAIRYEEKALDMALKCVGISNSTKTMIRSKLAKLYYKKGVSCKNENKLEEAISWLTKALSKEQNGKYFAGRGVCNYHLKNFKAASIDYDMADSLKSINKSTYYDARGIIAIKLNDFDYAKFLLQKLENLRPHNARTFRAWSLFYAMQNKKNLALDNLEKAIEKGYDNWEWIKTEEGLESIRKEARYKALIKGKD